MKTAAESVLPGLFAKAGQVHTLTAIRCQFRRNSLAPKIPTGNQEGFNCWGFVAYYNGWTLQPTWVNRRDMEAHLAALTRPVPEAKVRNGDIAVFHRNQELTHAAIVLNYDEGLICHKPGYHPLETLGVVTTAHLYGKVSFVRANPQKKLCSTKRKSKE